MGDTIVIGEPATPQEALRKRAHAAWVAVIMEELLPALRVAAKAKGYALAVHGSMARDVDLLAAPWADDAASAEELFEALLAATIATLDSGFALKDDKKGTRRPHGRRSFVIHIGPKGYLDISIMPRRPPRRRAA